MRKISVRYGKFPEILPLNSNFRRDRRLLKVVLEVEKHDLDRLGDFGETYRRLTQLFPSIKRHNCCHDSPHTKRTRTREGIPIKETDLYANIAHLTEHLIIDLIGNISELGSVSGVTCGHQKPISRHDIFVECPRRELGIFATNLALEVMENLSNGTVQKNRVKKLSKLAKVIERGRGRGITLTKISDRLGSSREEAKRLLEDYRRLTREKSV
jgi:hypothetical protein